MHGRVRQFVLAGTPQGKEWKFGDALVDVSKKKSAA
jgi:hypothetical protein